MAYISQYEVDMNEDAKRNNIFKGVGQAVQNGMDWKEENRKRALLEKNAKQKEDIAFAQAGANPEIIAAARESGDLSGLQKFFSDDYSAKKLAAANALALDTDVKRSQINKNNRAASAPAKMSEEDKIDMRIAKEAEAKNAEGARPLPGFEIQPGYRLEDKDRELLKTQNAAASNIQTVGKRLIDGLDKNGITSGFGFTDADKNASQNISEMQLQLKELFNLGAITGPDMDLVNANMGKLQGPLDMLNPFNTREDAKNQIKNVINSAIQRVSGTAEARGARYLPAQGQPQAVAQSPQVQAKIQQYTPEQKTARLQELRMKASKTGMR